jgi:hypothetical protein
VMLADLVAAMRSKVQPELASARGFAASGAVLVGGVLVALLVRSPWTSLEWTGGMSLRYVLPLFVLIGTFGLTAGFPLSWRWPDSRPAADVVGAAAAVVSVCWLLVSQHSGAAHFSAVPRVTLGFLVAGFALVAALGLSMRAPAAGRSAAVGALVLGIATVWAPLIAARDAREQAAAKKLEQQEWLASADPRARVRAARQIYFQTLDAEVREARTCERRQFFVLTRFDEPLALQSTVYRNVMFYAARDVALAERAGPIGPCDYIITSRAVMDTIKGQALVAALAHGAATREIAATSPFVVLARTLPQ